MPSLGPVLCEKHACEAPDAWPGYSFSVSWSRLLKFCAFETHVHRDSSVNGFSESNVEIVRDVMFEVTMLRIATGRTVERSLLV